MLKVVRKKGSSKYRVWSGKVLVKHRVFAWTKTPSKNRFQAGKMIFKLGQFRRLLLKIQSLVCNSACLTKGLVWKTKTFKEPVSDWKNYCLARTNKAAPLGLRQKRKNAHLCLKLIL
jgi:hypothetical protein